MLTDKELREAIEVWKSLLLVMEGDKLVKPSNIVLARLSGYTGSDKYIRGTIKHITLPNLKKITAVIGDKYADERTELIEIANLAAGMIMSINTPVTAKVGDNIAVPEAQARLLRRIEAALEAVGEL